MHKAMKVTPRCPIRTTLEMLGGKWKLLIIYQIGDRAVRFGELKRSLPDISEKMLVQELKSLADSELVVRHSYGEVPPRVDYRLTEQGKMALPLIDHLRDFGQGYVEK
jgi:DNA-binding HxlR family transcriptional regulator